MVTDRPRLDPTTIDVDELAIDPVAYLSSIEELAGLLVEDTGLIELLEQVLELTSRAIEASAAVSVTVVDDDGAHATAAASSQDARDVDDAQYEFDEGPCVEALRTGREHRFDDLTELDRWPRFRERALALGFGSVLAVPLRAGTETIGCLNVFAAEPGGLTDDDRLVARRIAAPAATTLANARAYRRVSRLAEQLQEALERRALIERARGVLIAAGAGDQEAAMAQLRAISQDQDRSLSEVATEILDRLAAGNGGERTTRAGDPG
ncbi:GAF and ANTAR domain-containing protein [Nitriliruptor alkaliphilus]|uniref:GAF and ANTAR domain-containing protein n=1 Tax=Nitriliruptor alkaliphilus TaxID=427918 RepID=UPI000696138B|nr:GAF and ANTAR domain-containing protein [Nitriliruptor alkaliphilus]